MTAFSIDLNTEQPDRIFVEVDHRFDVAIERTGTGLHLRVYPRTDGDLWMEPFITFEVDEAEIITLEKELGTDAVFATSHHTHQDEALMPAARRMHETLEYLAQMLADFKPDFLRQLGLDVALEKVEEALRLADGEEAQPTQGGL